MERSGQGNTGKYLNNSEEKYIPIFTPRTANWILYHFFPEEISVPLSKFLK